MYNFICEQDLNGWLCHGPTHLCLQYSMWAFGCIEVVLITFFQIVVSDFQAFVVCNLLNPLLEDSLGFKSQLLQWSKGLPSWDLFSLVHPLLDWSCKRKKNYEQCLIRDMMLPTNMAKSSSKGGQGKWHHVIYWKVYRKLTPINFLSQPSYLSLISPRHLRL